MNKHLTPMPQSLETGLVALSLSVVARLQQAFLATRDDSRRNFLLAAADFMDRTLPAKELGPVLRAAAQNPVPALVANREQIAAVPPGLWHAQRIEASQLGAPHAQALPWATMALRRELGKSQAQAREELVSWLEPAWAAYPQLMPEVLELLDAGQSAR